ncbi:Predicted metal-dependent phosphohydrolase, HD superfamily [Mucilaginibacter gossypiicola]|uniref:Predicted metal-dependent phosphohydrolase, HD superfamily n=1 Tax=Mucilaginibacter gossypiicola TaxID=551995 RepID=A0A1H8B3F4_9SPHI|nr:MULTISPECIES: hypothetical protein [Mucilaginibacter]UOE52182.1 hypothetical protein MTO98_13945 [Mucilaginibacter sp. SMC90]SEM76377.1 Predicted metal-dependent phosphohydrolase, HD superfamily [Mucilaginibacter gossypiicola]
MNELIKKTEEYIINLLGQKLAVGMVYHNLDHTQLMVAAVNDLCTEMHLNEWEQEILMVSAWFHDSGYCYTYQGHEAISMTIAGDFLRSMGKKDLFINPVNECIRATQMPQEPKTHFQAIMCDADMRHLALPDFAIHSERLRMEWANVLDKEYSNSDWVRQNLQFLSDHTYFTAHAKKHWEPVKQRNISQLKSWLTDQVQNDFSDGDQSN